jgi:chromate transport protein ChrA
MEISERINPTHKYDRLAFVSFVLGVTALIFPIISLVYLLISNGGPGYLQSIFCGVPVALTSVIVAFVSLSQRKTNNQAINWMAISGIVFGVLFFVISSVMILVLIFPYLSGIAH